MGEVAAVLRYGYGHEKMCCIFVYWHLDRYTSGGNQTFAAEVNQYAQLSKAAVRRSAGTTERNHKASFTHHRP